MQQAVVAQYMVSGNWGARNACCAVSSSVVNWQALRTSPAFSPFASLPLPQPLEDSDPHGAPTASTLVPISFHCVNSSFCFFFLSSPQPLEGSDPDGALACTVHSPGSFVCALCRSYVRSLWRTATQMARWPGWAAGSNGWQAAAAAAARPTAACNRLLLGAPAWQAARHRRPCAKLTAPVRVTPSSSFSALSLLCIQLLCTLARFMYPMQHPSSLIATLSCFLCYASSPKLVRCMLLCSSWLPLPPISTCARS